MRRAFSVHSGTRLSRESEVHPSIQIRGVSDALQQKDDRSIVKIKYTFSQSDLLDVWLSNVAINEHLPTSPASGNGALE
jgi:hypothetical protein